MPTIPTPWPQFILQQLGFWGTLGFLIGLYAGDELYWAAWGIGLALWVILYDCVKEHRKP